MNDLPLVYLPEFRRFNLEEKNNEITSLSAGSVENGDEINIEDLEEVSGGADCDYNVNCPSLKDPPPPPDLQANIGSN
jgi:hypothetical protein